MAEYIDRAKLIERIEYYMGHTGGEAHYAYSVALKEIRNAPAEDVLPVVHGEWNENKWPFCNVCPICGLVIDRTGIKMQSGGMFFCANCGAKMSRKKKDEGCF